MILPRINIGGAVYSASINIDNNTVQLINYKTRRIMRVEIADLADVRVNDLRDVLIAHNWTIIEG